MPSVGEQPDLVNTEDSSCAKPHLLADHAHIHMPTRIELIHETAALLTRRAVETGVITEQRGGELLMALVEALVNAVVHGNLEMSSASKEQPGDAFRRTLAERSNDPRYSDRLVDIRIDCDGQHLCWTIADEGPGFDAAARLRRLDEARPEDLDLSSGRGILMMRAFTDDLRWSPEGREVRLIVNRTASERRQRDRTPVREPVRVIPLDEEGRVDWPRAFEALAVDASAEGLSLVQSQLDSARHMLVEIPYEGRTVYLPAKVCHVRRLGDMVQIGCRFNEPAPAPANQRQETRLALEQLIQRARMDGACRPRHDDQRQHVRAAYAKTIGIRAAGQDSFVTVLARDLSLGGMAFLSQRPLDLHRDTEIQFVEEGAALPVMQARVVRCLRISKDVYDIGVRFR